MNIQLIDYEFSLYMFQQLLNRLLYMNLYVYSPFFIFFVLLSGLITALNPCTVSIVPIIFTTINQDFVKKYYFISFFIGLLTVITILLFICSIIGYRYYIIVVSLPFFSSVFSMFIGLFLLKIFTFNISMSIPINNERLVFRIIIKNFFLGCLLAINILPCCIPMLLTLLNLLSSSNNYILISFYCLIYLLGYILPLCLFILIILRISFIKSIVIFSTINIYAYISGCLMLGWGILKFLEIVFL